MSFSICPYFSFVHPKKVSKEKDAFFKEFFGESAKNRVKILAEQRLKKIVAPESREFQHIFSEKGIKNGGE